jgi:hypothetical protein
MKKRKNLVDMSNTHTNKLAISNLAIPNHQSPIEGACGSPFAPVVACLTVFKILLSISL